MNPTATFKDAPLPDYRAALERARVVFVELAGRAAGRLKSSCGATASRIAAKRRAAQESGLSVEGRVSLGPKKSVVLVHCHGRHYLIASAGDTIAPILEVLPVTSKKMPVGKSSQTGSKLEGPGRKARGQ